MAGEDHHVQDQPLPDDQAVDQLRRRQRDQESSGRLVRVHRPQLRGQDDGTGQFQIGLLFKTITKHSNTNTIFILLVLYKC